MSSIPFVLNNVVTQDPATHAYTKQFTQELVSLLGRYVKNYPALGSEAQVQQFHQGTVTVGLSGSVITITVTNDKPQPVPNPSGFPPY